MSRTVLFDFGGVVIKTPFELLDTPWRGPFDTTTDPMWVQSQTGVISEREYWERRAAEFHPGSADPTFDFMRPLYDVEETRIVRPEILALLDELDATGHRTAVLTNDLAAFHPDDWIERMTVIRRFSPVIDLSHVGFLKPAPEAFDHACKVLEVEPEQVVFLDDQKQNIAGAEAFGLHAVWFDPTDVEGSLDRLRAAL